tara:strand:+ start:273 stop:1460 length:1188 start_codon:yes stop_codon:yes gene_type:complete
MATKLEIETNLEEKVVNVISKIYDINKFAVTTNIALVSSTNSNLNTNQPQSFGSLQLEGILPAVPQKSEGKMLVNTNDYRVQIKDITVWLDYDLDIIDARNNIRPFLFKTMDWLADCENCIQFQRTEFSKNSNSNLNGSSSASSNIVDSEDISIIEDNITYLMDQLDKLNDSINSEGYGSEKHQWMIDYLERNLEEEKDASSNLSDKLMSLQDRIISRDSSIIMNTTLGQKEIAQTAMQENTRIVEKNIDNQFENNRYMLIVLFILIGVVILLVILSFFNKGPKTVYLKPKGNNTGSGDQNETASILKDDITGTPTHTNDIGASTTIEQPIIPSPTGAYADDSVIQSDLKNIKQSAVKMSVGQKHGASQIVKDWLDDGGESNEDNNDNTKDETEE